MEFYSIKDARAAAEAYVNDPYRVNTGFKDIDKALPEGGFRLGQLAAFCGEKEYVCNTLDEILPKENFLASPSLKLNSNMLTTSSRITDITENIRTAKQEGIEIAVIDLIFPTDNYMTELYLLAQQRKILIIVTGPLNLSAVMADYCDYVFEIASNTIHLVENRHGSTAQQKI